MEPVKIIECFLATVEAKMIREINESQTGFMFFYTEKGRPQKQMQY